MEGAPYKLRRLHRTLAGSTGYLDDVLARIHRAARQFESNADVTVQRTWGLYASGTPLLGLWVALDAHDGIVGHALADVREWESVAVGWITQVVMDFHVDGIPEQFTKECDAWIANINELGQVKSPTTWVPIKQVLMVTPRMTDAWERYGGFKLHRQVRLREVQ